MLKTQTNAYHPEVQFQCISTAFIPFLKYLFVDSSINSNLTCAAISIIGCNFICRPWPSRRYCNKLPWHTNSVTMKIGSSLEQTAYRLTCNGKFQKYGKMISFHSRYYFVQTIWITFNWAKAIFLLV